MDTESFEEQAKVKNSEAKRSEAKKIKSEKKFKEKKSKAKNFRGEKDKKSSHDDKPPWELFELCCDNCALSAGQCLIHTVQRSDQYATFRMLP